VTREDVQANHKQLEANLKKLLENEMHQVHEEQPQNGDEAWKLLMQGNKRFAEGSLVKFLTHLGHEISPDRRHELTTGQKPFVTVVTCSDSRVSPELIFDQGLGHIFVIRVAGNVFDKHAFGTVEYGLHHLNTPLLVLMGHEACGAVTAALHAKLDSEPATDDFIGHLLKAIAPAARAAKAEYPNEEQQADAVKRAVHLNILNSKNAFLEAIPLAKELISGGKLKVVTCVYHLTTGVVEEVS